MRRITSLRGLAIALSAITIAFAFAPSPASAAAPVNYDFYLGEPVVSAPANFDFESGLDGWSIENQDGGTSADTTGGGVSGNALIIAGNASLRPHVISSPFTIASDGPVFSFHVNTLGNGSAQYNVSIAPAPCASFTQIASGGTSTAGWQRVDINVSSYVGQSVCIRYRAYETVLFDEGATYKIPHWTVDNGTPRLEERVITDTTNVAAGDYNLSETSCVGEALDETVGPAARLFNNSRMTSEAFTIPVSDTDLRFLFDGAGLGSAATISLALASEGYAVQHVIYNKIIGESSVLTACDITEWAGETVKISIASSFGGTVYVAVGGTTSGIDRFFLSEPVVVLLHGILSNCDAMNDIRDRIRAAYLYDTPAENERVECFRIGSLNGYDSPKGARYNASRLKEYIAQLRSDLGMQPGEAIHIVGHSFGGLVARYYREELNYTQEGPIETLFMLGTPNEGAHLANLQKTLCPGFGIPFFADEIADFICDIFPALDLPDLGGEDITELQPGSSVLDTLNDDFSPPVTTFYSGHAGLFGGTLGGLIFPDNVPNDCIVSADSVFGPNNLINGPMHDLLSHTANDYCSQNSLTNATQVSDSIIFVIDNFKGDPGGLAIGEAASAPPPDQPDAPPFADLQLGGIRPSELETHQIAVPAGMTSAAFTVFWSDTQNDPQLDIVLRRPDASVVDLSDPDVLDEIEVTSDGFAHVLMRGFEIDAPVAGTWEIDVSGTSLPVDGAPYIVALTPQSQVVLALATTDADLSSNDAQLVTATLFDDASVIEASSLTAEVRKPDGDIDPLALVDDGTGVDKVAGDFTYTGSFANTADCGGYRIFAEATGTSSEGSVTRHQAKAFDVVVPGDAVRLVCDADEDDDLLTDESELSNHLTDPFDADTDDDGCIDGDEAQTAGGSQTSGGLRSPRNAHDYFNPTGDGLNRVDDVLAVVNQYFDDDNDANPGLPPYQPGYNPDTDRTLAGPNPWNTGPGNGLQRVDDILYALNQYFHDCA